MRPTGWLSGPAAAACAVLLLGGCADESEGSMGTTGATAPDGSITLVETRPQPVGEARVVAFNIAGEEAMVGVAEGDGPSETAPVRVGDAVSIDGQDWEVVRIQEGDSGDGAPGSKNGEVVIAPPD